MAEMQLIAATVYSRYRSTISPMTSDKDMELEDQVTLSGPMVRSLVHINANNESRSCWIEFEAIG